MVSSSSLFFVGGLFCSAVSASVLRSSGANCRQGLDIVFLQDTTGTFMNDLPIVTDQIPTIYENVEKVFPGTWFGVAEFKDKPIWPLGYPAIDYCYKLSGHLTDDLDEIKIAYGNLYASAGGDLPEASYQGLINVALDANVGWRPLSTTNTIDTTKSAARVVILITDAQPHMAGDMVRLHQDANPPLPDLPANPGTIWQDQFDEFCMTYDYPHYDQVRDVLKAQGINVIFLIKPDPRDEVVQGAWEWVNSGLLEQPEWFVKEIGEDSKDLADVLVAILQELSLDICSEENGGNGSNGSNGSDGNGSNGSNGSDGNGSNGSNGSDGNGSNGSNGSDGNNSNGSDGNNSNGSDGNNSNGSDGNNSNGGSNGSDGNGSNGSGSAGGDGSEGPGCSVDDAPTACCGVENQIVINVPKGQERIEVVILQPTAGSN